MTLVFPDPPRPSPAPMNMLVGGGDALGAFLRVRARGDPGVAPERLPTFHTSQPRSMPPVQHPPECFHEGNLRIEGAQEAEWQTSQLSVRTS